MIGKEDKIEVFYLPPYSPETNPDEILNRDLKTELRTRPAAKNVDALKKKGTRFHDQTPRYAEARNSLLRQPSHRYAALARNQTRVSCRVNIGSEMNSDAALLDTTESAYFAQADRAVSDAPVRLISSWVVPSDPQYAYQAGQFST